MTAQNKKISPPKASKTSNTVFLFLSLYLLLLAFFILLNALSKVEKQKQEQAFKSLVETFAQEEDEDLPYIEGLGQTGSQLATTGFFAPIGTLAKEMISLTDADIVEKGNTMILKIPTSAFYVQGAADIQGKQQAFMNRLADELTKMGLSADINLQMNLGLLIGTKTADTTAQGETNLALLRAGNFARVITSMGVKESAVYVGLVPDADPNVIEMTFATSEKRTEKERPF